MPQPIDDLTLTLSPQEQIVFRKALRSYHAERRAAFARQVTIRRAGDAHIEMIASRNCALVLSLIETCRQALNDDTWTVTDATD